MSKITTNIEKYICALFFLGAILPFALPESNWLVNSFLFGVLGNAIPSASKLSEVAQHQNIVKAYIIIMLSIACVMTFRGLWLDRNMPQTMVVKMMLLPSKKLLKAWLIMMFSVVWFGLLVWLIYAFPLPLDADRLNSRGVKGTLRFILTYKLGLATFGGFTAAGALVLGFLSLSCLHAVLAVPFLIIKSKIQG